MQAQGYDGAHHESVDMPAGRRRKQSAFACDGGGHLSSPGDLAAFLVRVEVKRADELKGLY